MALLPSSLLSSSSSTLSSFSPRRHVTVDQELVLPSILRCKVGENESIKVTLPIQSISKRSFSLSLSCALLLPLAAGNVRPRAEAAVLEAEDDLELLEKVKNDRKKRLERQGIINSSKQETGYLQDLVYKLSEVGRAIDNNDLSTASLVLGENTETDWIKKANSAFSKVLVIY